MERFEVAIVGAGVVGAAAAWALAREGRQDVVVLDRFAADHELGSSHGPTRIFRYAYDDPFYVSLAKKTLPLWRELEHQTGRTLLTITGGLDVGHTEYLTSGAAALRSQGAPADILDAREMADRFPGLTIGARSGLWSPDTGVLAAERSVAAMLAASGAQVRRPVTVLRIDHDDDGATLHTQGGLVHARTAIVTAGAWNGPLLAAAGIDLPLQVTQEQVFHFPGGEGLPVFIERAALFRYMVPPMHGAPGAKVGEHTAGDRTTADERSGLIEPAGAERVRDWVAAAMPALTPQPVQSGTCLYTMTPDEDFIVDAKGPIVFASPCSGHGFKFAPLIGQMLAALATGAVPPAEIERFSAARF